MLTKLRKRTEKAINLIVKALAKLGIKPWMVTTLGLILSIIAGIILFTATSEYDIICSIMLYSFGCLMDAFDGALARFLDQTSNWGAVYDSVSDRIGEIAFSLGLFNRYICSMDFSEVIITLYISTSLLISYIRAKGEALHISLEAIGIMERGDRVLSILAALALWLILKISFEYFLIILLAMNIITILQRLYHIKESID